MPGSVDYCRTTPSLCTNGDFDPLQRHPYSPISDWWHRVYMCILIHEGKFHLSPLSAVSIASKDFTRFQIVSWNPSMKLEINCAFIRSPLNCISNTDMLQTNFLWQYWCYSKDGSFWLQRTMPILSSIPFPCITPSMCRVMVHLVIILLLFRVDVLKFFQIHSNRKLTDPHFQEKLWPISVHPCQCT